MTRVTDEQLDMLHELGIWAYWRDLDDKTFRERARLILEMPQAPVTPLSPDAGFPFPVHKP